MKTANGFTAGIFQLVFFILPFAGSVKGEGYDAVLLGLNVSLTQPDPLKPFPTGGSNLYLTDPQAQINTNTEVFFSVRWGFKGRESGQWVSLKRPNFAHATFSMSGRYEQNGTLNTTSMGGNNNLVLSESIYTDRNSLNPNPTTGGAWIYGLDDVGRIATPTGQPIRDPNGVPMNGGAYTVSSDANLKVSEFWVVGARGKLSAGFVNGYKNLSYFAANFGAKFNLFLSFGEGMTIHSALGPTEGCMSRVQYDLAFQSRHIYCGNERGAVQLGLTIENQNTLRIRNGRLTDFLIQRSPDLVNWSPASVPTVENLIDGDTRLTFPVPTTPITTHPPDGPRCYYRLAIPDP